MSHHYVVRPKIDKSGAEEKIRYYGVPVTTGLITTDELAERIASHCSLSKGDVLAAVSELTHQIVQCVGMGFTVDLRELGQFNLSATSEGFENAADCTPSRVKPNRLCFKMSNLLRNKIKHIKFERKPTL